MVELEKIKVAMENNPSVMDAKCEGFSIVSEILNMALIVPKEQVLECIEIAEMVFSYNSDLPDMPLTFERDLFKIGFMAYTTKSFETAEKTFSILSQCGNAEGRNYYAFMIRRKETKEKSDDMLIKAVHLIREGIAENDAFSFVNMGLLLALEYGDDEDWLLCDDLIKSIPKTQTEDVLTWWKKIGIHGDIEEVLVNYFLLRHGKIKKSSFGSKKKISDFLSEKIPNFPQWLKEESHFSSLDAVFDTMLDDDFDENLTEYFKDMPLSRKAAEEIMAEMKIWDEWELYRVLLQNYISFLTNDEIKKIIRAYKKKFLMPLSTIIDESTLNNICE